MLDDVNRTIEVLLEANAPADLASQGIDMLLRGQVARARESLGGDAWRGVVIGSAGLSDKTDAHVDLSPFLSAGVRLWRLRIGPKGFGLLPLTGPKSLFGSDLHMGVELW